MDIEYLLLLQNFREATNNVLSPLMNGASKFAVDVWPILMMCFIYWALDREGGRRILGGFSLALFFNGLLKLIFCVYRPWIRDDRVLPFGDSKVAATGYSFPSGHSTWATSILGGIGIWLWRNSKRILSAIFWAFVALVLFSRNYLGVHTPQDVVVGCAASALMIWAAYKLEAWTDADPSRDLTVLVAGVVLAVASGAFYLLKPYPMDYQADGSLLVDPTRMMIDSFQGLGLLSSYVICRYFERRGPDFEALLTKRQRLVAAAVFIPLLALWMGPARTALMATIDPRVANFVTIFCYVAFVFVLIPRVLGLVARRLNSEGRR